MSYLLDNQIRATFSRELDAIESRKRSGIHDPRAETLVPRAFETWERISRAEEAQRVVEVVLRDKLWAPDPRLDQWVESVWCMPFGLVSAGAAAAIPLGPLDVITDGSIVGYLQGELGITIATGVSAWASQIGGTTIDLTQGTGANQPAYTANNATLWARSTVTGDGSNDEIGSTTWDPPTPGTTPTHFRAIAARQSRIASAASCWCGSASTRIAFREAATVGSVRAFNGTNSADVVMTEDQWYRVNLGFNNSAVTDALIVGSNTSGAAALGGSIPVAGFHLFASSAIGATPGNFSIQKLLIRNVLPTALESALLDGIDTRFYNGNIML